jgi:hypothetical protein
MAHFDHFEIEWTATGKRKHSYQKYSKDKKKGFFHGFIEFS